MTRGRLTSKIIHAPRPSIAANYTSSGPLYFEVGNENWNSGGPVNYSTGTLNTLYSASTGFSSVQDYMGYRYHVFSQLAQTYLPSGWWGTRAFQVDGQQAAGGNGSYYTQVTLAAMRTRYGAAYPAADVHYVAVAPYVTTPLTSSDANDSVATLLSKFNATIPVNSGGLEYQDSEAMAALAVYYGLKGTITYEGGGQWNAVNSGNPDQISNLGAALLSSGMTASIENLYQILFDFGFSDITHFGTGVSTGGDAASPVDELANIWTAGVGISPSNSPTLTALQSFMPGPTYTRNVVTPGAGSSFSGANWNDNLTTTIYGNFASHAISPASNQPTVQSGNVLYLVKSTAAGSTTLSITLSNVSGTGANAPQTQVEVNGTNLRTVAGLANGSNNLGTISLQKGLNYIRLGVNNSAQGTTAQNQITLLQFQ